MLGEVSGTPATAGSITLKFKMTTLPSNTSHSVRARVLCPEEATTGQDSDTRGYVISCRANGQINMWSSNSTVGGATTALGTTPTGTVLTTSTEVVLLFEWTPTQVRLSRTDGTAVNTGWVTSSGSHLRSNNHYVFTTMTSGTALVTGFEVHDGKGTGTGTTAWVGAGAGSRPAKGTGSGVFTFAGAGAGVSPRSGASLARAPAYGHRRATVSGRGPIRVPVRGWSTGRVLGLVSSRSPVLGLGPPTGKGPGPVRGGSAVLGSVPATPKVRVAGRGRTPGPGRGYPRAVGLGRGRGVSRVRGSGSRQWLGVLRVSGLGLGGSLVPVRVCVPRRATVLVSSRSWVRGRGLRRYSLSPRGLGRVRSCGTALGWGTGRRSGPGPGPWCGLVLGLGTLRRSSGHPPHPNGSSPFRPRTGCTRCLRSRVS
jgi:hypothetical protein